MTAADKPEILVRGVFAQKDVQKRMIAASFDPADTTVDAFDQFVAKDVKLYQRIVQASGIKLE